MYHIFAKIQWLAHWKRIVVSEQQCHNSVLQQRLILPKHTPSNNVISQHPLILCVRLGYLSIIIDIPDCKINIDLPNNLVSLLNNYELSHE